MIDRQLRALPAHDRFVATCRAAGLQRLYLPSFERWLAPREPLVDQPHQGWAATFERRDTYLAVDPRSPRLYVRQLRLHVPRDASLSAAFLTSPARAWCEDLVRHEGVAGAHGAWLAQMRNGFVGLLLLFEPDAALTIQTRPGAQLEHVLDATSTVHTVILED